MSRRETVRIDNLQFFHETDKGMLVGFDPDSTVWLPKSVVEATDLDKPGDEGWVEIPMWLAQEKELLENEVEWLND